MSEAKTTEQEKVSLHVALDEATPNTVVASEEDTKESLLLDAIAHRHIFPYPKLSAGVWFSAAAVVAALIVNLIYFLFVIAWNYYARGTFGDHNLEWFLSTAINGIVVAVLLTFLPGMIVGSPILDSGQVKTKQEAGERGGSVALWAHFCAPFAIGAIGLFLFPPSSLLGALLGALSGLPYLFITMISWLLTFGLVTVPIGYFAGKQLFALREAQLKPQGCKLHGYRENETTKQIEVAE